jgi:hypothetical protein
VAYVAYNEERKIRMAKTLHVYRFDGVWAVKKDGKRAETFDTRREAVATAVRSGRKAKSAQVVVHGTDGRILEHRTFGMPRVQEPPKRGRLTSKSIATAVGKIVLDRLHADSLPPRAHTPSK